MKQCNLFIAGAQRSGTTALKYYLDQHPQLTSGKGKEVHFYDRWYAAAPTKPLRDTLYRMKFPRHSKEYLLDISPSYIFLPHAIERAARDRPDARIVVILRSPVARAVSQWRLETHRGDEELSFTQAIRRPTEERNVRHHSYLERGLYDKQLKRMLAVYPRENILALRSEELRRKPEEAIARVWEHFQLVPFNPVPPTSPVHASQVDFHPSEEDVVHLLEFYEESIKAVGRILEWEISSWLDPTLAARL